jgi:formyl-CoA transferase
MTEPGLPLAGLRVLDISSFIAAPAAAVVLGDWGADVIKIEGPDGDANRRIMHDSSNYPKGEVNYPWQMDSRNKRSLVLDSSSRRRGPRRPPHRHLRRAGLQLPPPVRDKLKLAMTT